ncbi:MAG: hypothetical protein AB2A00_25505 [Myxococcota bacterium]
MRSIPGSRLASLLSAGLLWLGGCNLPTPASQPLDPAGGSSSSSSTGSSNGTLSSSSSSSSGGPASTTSGSGSTSGSTSSTSSSGSSTSSATGGTSTSTTSCTDPTTDCPATGTACVVAVCSAGQCATNPAAAHTTCSDNGGTVCDGSGACVACRDAADCPATGNDCFAPTCINNQCGTQPVDASTPIRAQATGDCLLVVCDGSGGTTTVPDDTDVPVDTTLCTADSCASGNPVHTPLSGACSDNGGVVCADTTSPSAGTCVACNSNADCAGSPPRVCVSHLCVVVDCANFQQDGDETDEDCGGSCPPCVDGSACLVAADCVSQVCNGALLTCSAPDCGDNVQNGLESAIDCGGGTCPTCNDGDTCAQAADCTSGVCGNGPPSLCLTATCLDGVLNGGESALDCGAVCGTTLLCANGQTCNGAADCDSGFCSSGLCAPCVLDSDCATDE